MRNLFVLICVLCSISTFAQKKVANYHCDYFDRDFEISISTDKKDPSTISNIYIDVAGERKSETVTLKYEYDADVKKVVDDILKNIPQGGKQFYIEDVHMLKWILDEMETAYGNLHKAGYAVGVESYIDGKMAGGLYGVVGNTK